MIKIIPVLALLGISVSALSLNAEPLEYKIDSGHSGVSFKIRHLVNKVPGEFGAFSGKIVFDAENPSASSVVAAIEAKSVSTQNERRDNHLRNEDFFDVETYPQLTFASTSWEKVGENTFKVVGDLTMLGQTHPVTLDVELLGTVEARGNEVTGWVGTTKLDRTQWGMDSRAIIGDDVEVELNIQAHRPLSAAAE